MLPVHTLGPYVDLRTWRFGHVLTILKKGFLLWSHWLPFSLDSQSSLWVNSTTGLLSLLRGEG